MQLEKPAVVNIKTQNNGFTFIELLIVIAIIGVLSGMVIPNLKATQSNFQMDGFVKDVYYLSKYLQVAAISRSRIYRLDITNDIGKTFFSAKYKNADGEFIPLGGGFKKEYAMPLDLEIASMEPPDKLNIFFYPDASVDEATMVFKNKSGKEMTLIFKGAGSAIQIK